jgi:heme/copper-type cytochrome/quinol oxidase subunit 2
MRGFVTVQSADEFDKWLASKVAESSEPDPFR